MIATHKIELISFDENFIYLHLDGKQLKAPLSLISKKLLEADDLQRQFYKISPSGYGIHWPLIDEDLSVDAIIKSAE
jgi:hypothetical protein